jgi:5-methylthioadenosine/S-adenosylhomocysteine deaminase
MWLEAITAFGLATAGSARVLGMQDQIGQIGSGFKADLVFLDLDHINYLPLNNLIHQIVHVEDGSAVRHVMVGGRMVVKDGNIVTVDVQALRRRSAEAAERLRATNVKSRETAERLAPFVSRFCYSLGCECSMSDRSGPRISS